jgi:hypothetical protein
MTALAKPAAIVKDRPVLSSETMLHKNYDRKGSIAKKKKKIYGRDLKGLGAKTK